MQTAAGPTLPVDETKSEIEPGVKLGNYEIVSKLGAGGMGVVYLAQQIFLRSEAAIKVLSSSLTTDEEMVERFFNEARAATEIRHPGIVQVYDFGYAEDRSAYIVMEYLRGESLDGRIKRVACLDLDDALIFTRQIAGALAAAHRAKIVHRDLKPDNIFLVPDPEVPGGERIKLLDFGIAKLTENQLPNSLTRTGALMGTPAFMSPEQCTGARKVDKRTDLYSLGCILFQMLCGQPPFVRYGAGAVMAAHLYEPPPPPSSLRPMPSDIEALILRLLAKSPSERFPSAESLIETIEGLSTIPHSAVVALARPPTVETISGPPPVAQRSPSGSHAATGANAGARPTGEQTAVTSGQRALWKYAALAGGFLLAGALGAVLLTQRDAPPPVAGGVQTEVAPGTAAAVEKPSGDQPVAAAKVEEAAGAAVEQGSAATPAAPPAAAMVTVRIESNPPGAEVYRKLDSLRLGVTPLEQEWPVTPGEYVYVVRLDGYQDKEIAIAAGESQDYKVELEAKPVARKSRRRSSSSTPTSTKPSGADSPKKPAGGASSKALDPFGDM
ncbi:serine/threonine protein kinase [Haliangium ochraceum DSM 14365]|uniref:Serine/threonine protein kinase n=1 Tax=Haliangium ochraceum (strain DSM 14365 / JCM 11303 / SMP-2) TaxID=502025 RepID=D0LQM7_HALO1|nr:serine/threonine protein kinase [Haliangium ochraceum DSM 14365]